MTSLPTSRVQHLAHMLTPDVHPSDSCLELCASFGCLASIVWSSAHGVIFAGRSGPPGEMSCWKPVRGHLQRLHDKGSVVCRSSPPIASSNDSPSDYPNESREIQEVADTHESRQEGHVRAGVWIAYARSAGWPSTALIAASLLLMQVEPFDWTCFILLNERMMASHLGLMLWWHASRKEQHLQQTCTNSQEWQGQKLNHMQSHSGLALRGIT